MQRLDHVFVTAMRAAVSSILLVALAACVPMESTRTEQRPLVTAADAPRDRAAMVREAQQLLAQSGFPPGPATGSENA